MSDQMNTTVETVEQVKKRVKDMLADYLIELHMAEQRKLNVGIYHDPNPEQTQRVSQAVSEIVKELRA